MAWWFRVAEDEEGRKQSVYPVFGTLGCSHHWEFVGHLRFRAKTVGFRERRSGTGVTPELI